MNVLLLLAAALAADPIPSPIRLPEIKGEVVPPQPMPADASVKLAFDVFYIVESDAPCLVFLSPGGAVSVTKEAGPLRIRGKFADGKGVSETRNFKSKYLYVCEAVKEGRDELIILPAGAADESTARRVTFQVGTMPQPPPDVKPDPKPPDVSANPFGNVTGLHVFISYADNVPLSMGQTNVLYGKAVRDYLQAKCATGPDGATKQFRIWPTATDANGESKLWQDVYKRPRASVPWIVIGNGPIGFEGPLPSDPTAALDLLKKYGG